MIDNLILETFETHDEHSYPIRTNNEARTFVKHLHNKGLPYTTLCQEVDATEVAFSSWMKGVNRTGIGRRIIDRINQQFHDVLVSDSDGEQAEMDNRSTDYFKRKFYTKTEVGAKGPKLLSSRFPLRSNGKTQELNAFWRNVATNGTNGHAQDNGHAQHNASHAKHSLANDKPDIDITSNEPKELSTNNVSFNIITADSKLEVHRSVSPDGSANPSPIESNLELRENVTDSETLDSILLASVSTEDSPDQTVNSYPSDLRNSPKEKPMEYTSTTQQSPTLIVAVEIDPDSKSIEPKIHESIDTKPVDHAAVVVDVDIPGAESDDLICTSNHIECSDPIDVLCINTDIEDTENYMFNKSMDDTIIPRSLESGVAESEKLTGSCENIGIFDNLVSSTNTEVNESPGVDYSDKYDMSSLMNKLMIPPNDDSKVAELEEVASSTENVQIDKTINILSSEQCISSDDIEELVEINHLQQQLLEEGSSVDYVDNADISENVQEEQHKSTIELKLTSCIVDAVQEMNDILPCSSPRRITVLEKSSFLSFDQPNLNESHDVARDFSELTSASPNQSVNDIDGTTTLDNHINGQGSGTSEEFIDGASQSKGFSESLECLLDQPAVSAMTDSMDNEFLLCIQQIESSIINFSELSNAVNAMEREPKICATQLEERQPSLTSSVSDENFSDYENVPSRKKLFPDYENVPNLSSVLKPKLEIKKCDNEMHSCQLEAEVISCESCLRCDDRSNISEVLLDVGTSANKQCSSEILLLNAVTLVEEGEEENKRDRETNSTEEEVTTVAKEGNTIFAEEEDSIDKISVNQIPDVVTLKNDTDSFQENVIINSENLNNRDSSIEASSNVVKNVFVEPSGIVENVVSEPSKGEYIYVLSDSMNDSSLHRVKIGTCQEPFHLIQQAKLFNVDIQLVSATLVTNGDVVLQAIYKRLEERKICGRDEWFVCPLATVLQTIAEAVNQ